METKKTSIEIIQALCKTIAKLSEASANLGQAINNLVFCNSRGDNRADNIKVDIDYLKWITLFVNERAKCVLENTCGRDGLNQISEEELSAKLSYVFFTKENEVRKKLKAICDGIHQAEAKGKDRVELLKTNTNVVDLIKDKVISLPLDLKTEDNQ